MVHELDISQIIDLLDTSLWRVGGAYFKASIESEGGWDRRPLLCADMNLQNFWRLLF